MSDRGPPPCQHPECDEPAILATGWTYCAGHGSTERRDPFADDDG